MLLERYSDVTGGLLMRYSGVFLRLNKSEKYDESTRLIVRIVSLQVIKILVVRILVGKILVSIADVSKRKVSTNVTKNVVQFFYDKTCYM